MNVYTTDKIRNVVLLGHGGCGKTSLAEAMAYLAGMTGRMGTVADGSTISDYDKEEIKRQFSIHTSLIPIPWQDVKINILDKSLYFSWFNKKYKSSEMVKDYRELSLTDNFYIPISYEKIKFIEYEVVDTSYTNDEAQIKANEIINNYIKNLNEKGIQIIENNVKIEISENKCFIYGDFLLLKQIGKIEYINEEDYNSKITVSQETE